MRIQIDACYAMKLSALISIAHLHLRSPADSTGPGPRGSARWLARQSEGEAIVASPHRIRHLSKALLLLVRVVVARNIHVRLLELLHEGLELGVLRL